MQVFIKVKSVKWKVAVIAFSHSVRLWVAELFGIRHSEAAVRLLYFLLVKAMCLYCRSIAITV